MSEDYRYYSHSSKIMEQIPDEDKFDSDRDTYYNEFSIDPREWIPHPDVETEEERELRFRSQFHNTLIREHTYPYEPSLQIPKGLDKTQIRKLLQKNDYIDRFNSHNKTLTLRHYIRMDYPTREEIDNFLLRMGLPTSLYALPVDQQFILRERYPYAWFSKDIPLNWLNNSISA